MELSAEATALERILPWRHLYQEEMNCQIIHDSIHVRPGWSLEYFLTADDAKVGYGSVAIGGPWKEKPTIYEFYVQPANRTRVFDIFLVLLRTSGARAIETQSNDRMLTVMLHTFAKGVSCESILYEDTTRTTYSPAGAAFRRATPADGLDIHPEQLTSHGIIEVEGKVAATGGILFHYNRPYGDIYMEVKEPFRRRGLGTYLVQELKRVCYEGGSVPSARCNPTNVASRKTLQKAGFVPCGNILSGSVPA
jgi:GNAT superfamily N-acetyltransferase